MITVAGFHVLHTIVVSLQRRHFGLYYHHPELIMLKKIKSYRYWSALKKCVPHLNLLYIFHIKIHEIWPEQSRKVMGWKSCLMSLYFKSEEDTTKNEIFQRLYIQYVSSSRLWQPILSNCSTWPQRLVSFCSRGSLMAHVIIRWL